MPPSSFLPESLLHCGSGKCKLFRNHLTRKDAASANNGFFRTSSAHCRVCGWERSRRRDAGGRGYVRLGKGAAVLGFPMSSTADSSNRKEQIVAVAAIGFFCSGS